MEKPLGSEELLLRFLKLKVVLSQSEEVLWLLIWDYIFKERPILITVLLFQALYPCFYYTVKL